MHVLMPHPMETGFRKDETGDFIAAHYITDVRIEVAGKLVLAATLSRAFPKTRCFISGSTAAMPATRSACPGSTRAASAAPTMPASYPPEPQ